MGHESFSVVDMIPLLNLLPHHVSNAIVVIVLLMIIAYLGRRGLGKEQKRQFVPEAKLTFRSAGEMIVDVLIGTPFPEKLDEEKVLEAIPLGKKRLKAVEGGLIARGVQVNSMGDDSADILVVNAAVTVSFDV